jgi:hypothetical protein
LYEKAIHSHFALPMLRADEAKIFKELFELCHVSRRDVEMIKARNQW